MIRLLDWLSEAFLRWLERMPQHRRDFLWRIVEILP
jgi:hypothetical protein